MELQKSWKEKTNDKKAKEISSNITYIYFAVLVSDELKPTLETICSIEGSWVNKMENTIVPVIIIFPWSKLWECVLIRWYQWKDIESLTDVKQFLKKNKN